jgi:hypothetical protein
MESQIDVCVHIGVGSQAENIRTLATLHLTHNIHIYRFEVG